MAGMATTLVVAALLAPAGVLGKTIEIGIGTQNTTTNTVTGGVVIKELGLLEKYLPKTGRYKDFKYKLNWQNATSGPPITNGMMADKIQIGMMGDYPLMVNGATGQATNNPTQLIAIIAYSVAGMASWSTRTPPITISPISKAKMSRCHLALPHTA
jgi:NitT/TauT family transport system substrate-binding protein